MGRQVFSRTQLRLSSHLGQVLAHLPDKIPWSDYTVLFKSYLLGVSFVEEESEAVAPGGEEDEEGMPTLSWQQRRSLLHLQHT